MAPIAAPPTFPTTDPYNQDLKETCPNYSQSGVEYPILRFSNNGRVGALLFLVVEDACQDKSLSLYIFATSSEVWHLIN